MVKIIKVSKYLFYVKTIFPDGTVDISPTMPFVDAKKEAALMERLVKEEKDG